LNARRLKRYFVLIVIIGLFITCLAGSSGQLVAQAALPGRQPVIDPFYLKVFEEAKMHFDRGDYKKAFENFKIAAFGLLDEPDLLGQAYAYLTVSAYQLGKADEVEHYLEQIARLKLFPRISSSSLPQEVKDKFKEICDTYKVLISG
jgi:tetratricopeptide (TPR) repeat protein